MLFANSLRFLTLMLLALSLPAQDTNFVAGGASFNGSGSPQFSVTGLYTRLLAGNTLSYIVFDAVPTTTRPYVIVNDLSIGPAQRMLTAGRFSLYTVTGAGVSWASGKNTGWTLNGGELLAIQLWGKWYIAPSFRFVKSSVNQNSGSQVLITVLIGKGFGE